MKASLEPKAKEPDEELVATVSRGENGWYTVTIVNNGHQPLILDNVNVLMPSHLKRKP